MQLKFKKSLSNKDNHLILPIFEDKKQSKIPENIIALIESSKKNEDFSGKSSETHILTINEPGWPSKLVLLGLGKSKDFNNAVARESFATVVKKLKPQNVGNIIFNYTSELGSYGQAIAEGCALGDYHLGSYQTGKSEKKHKSSELKNLIYFNDKKVKTFEAGLNKGLLIGSGVNFVRDLVNSPSNILDVAEFAKHARSVAKKSKSKLKILTLKEIKKLKMGAIIAVNQGSNDGANLVTIEHKPRGAKGDPIILVGKGVLFDTGGYNLKPSNGIDTMHMDMAGAALVLGVMSLLNDLDIKKHVIGITPVTTNMVDANAIKPNDIITSYSGKTIQILNTDAEGRLILADALTYAQKKWPKNEAVINFATLTGACMVALGDRYAGLFGNDQKLIDSLKSSSERTDEGAWPLPIHDDYFEAMKDDMADLRNIDRGTSKLASASKAAAFLKHFIEDDTKWAHLDIAGTGFVNRPKKYDYQYATGYGVRLIIDFLENC